MENKNQNTNEPEFEVPGLAAHEPKIDLARNKNLFRKSLIFAGVFVLILLAILGFQWCGNRSSENKIGQADQAMLTAGDSAQVAQAFDLYKTVADDAGYKSNERAQIITAEKLYQDGKYEEAIKYLDKPGVSSPVVAAGILCLKGDCYTNLDKNDEAAAAFEKALDVADNNPELTPYVLTKLSHVYRVKGDYTKELDILRRLQKEFPGYNPAIESDIARAEAQAAK